MKTSYALHLEVILNLLIGPLFFIEHYYRLEILILVLDVVIIIDTLRARQKMPVARTI